MNGDLQWESYGLPNNQILEKAERPATEKEQLPLGNYNDYHISQSFENHLEKHKEDLFFYVVGFRKPHLPFVAPKKFWELYNSSEIQVSDYDTAPIDGDTIVYQLSELAAYKGYSENYFDTNYRNNKVKNKDAKELIHGYMASISFIDSLLGRIIGKLEKLDLDEDTIIVLMSDHGFHLGD